MATLKNCSLHFISCFLTLVYLISSSQSLLDPIPTILGKEKVSCLRFYLHNIVTGTNATSKEVIATGKEIDFGAVFIDDDVLTESADPTSRIIGKQQGLVAFDAPAADPTLLVAVTFIFTDGEFNGSSLSILGRSHVLDRVRELPIVGGTGSFRFARGFVLARTVQLDLATANGIEEYNATVLHY